MPPPHSPISPEARRAVDLLSRRWQAFTDLRALADINVERGDQKQRLSGVILAKGPDSVRFEALSPFGQPILIGVVHDGRLTGYNALTNEAIVGDATAETTAQILGLPFEPEDLAGVVSGYAVPPRDLRMGEILPADAKGPSLSLVGAVHEQRIWMDFETGVISQLKIIGGRVDATVTYLRDPAGQVTGYDITAASRWVNGTVRYRNVALGVGLAPERFALMIPKHAKTRPIR
jgi:outer membrane lipoprotein-sorting protein